MKENDQLAHDIEGLVAAGTLRRGERLPSVRETVSRRGVSPSTVFKAYYLLESRGVVEVRPRSGYFVRAPRDAEPEPAAPPPPIGSTPVAVSDLVLEVLGSIGERDIVPMGSAFPSPLLFPLDRLERGRAAAMRRLDPGRTAGRRTMPMPSCTSACAGRHARAVERLKLSSTLSVAVPSQVAVLDYLQHGAFDKHLRGLRAALAARQQQARACVLRHFPDGTRVTRPEGGYFLWLQLPGGMDALHLHRLALAQRISIAPGHLFSTAPPFHDHMRLNVGHPAPQKAGGGDPRRGGAGLRTRCARLTAILRHASRGAP